MKKIFYRKKVRVEKHFKFQNEERAKILMPSVLQIAEFNILYDDWKINASKFIYKSEGLY